METVIFGGALGSLYAICYFCTHMGPVIGSCRSSRRCFTNLGWGMSGLWVVDHHSSFWVLVLSRTIGGIASGNPSIATIIADVTSRKDRSKSMAIVASRLGWSLCLDHWEVMQFMDWSDGSSAALALALSPWLVNKFLPCCCQFGLIVTVFQETLPAEKRPRERAARPAIFPGGNVANSAVRNTCLSYLCYMISFGGMELPLLSWRSKDTYMNLNITSMFLLIGLPSFFSRDFCA